MPKQKYKLPQSLYIYVCDHDSDGTPLLAVAETLDELPDDSDGELIGAYQMREIGKVVVRKSIAIKAV